MEPPFKRYRQEGLPIRLLLDSPAETPTLPTGVCKEPRVGAHTLQRLQSVERVFCSQTLDTPTQPLAQTPEPEDVFRGERNNIERLSSSECDFIISYSQNYRRVPSQDLGNDWDAGKEEGDGAGPSSWESEANRFSHEALQSASQDPQTTPELSAEPAATTPQTRKFFPLFRPKSEWKTIHIIRHGESEYNAATSAKDLGFADPQIYDPKLTAKGRRQASNLRATLENMKISKDALWVVSPLTRALETMVLACPHTARITATEHPPKVIVHKDISEHCQTTGDIGLPASIMKSKFPQFEQAMSGLPERWWFRQDANDAELKRFDKPEAKKQMRARVGEFRKWVQSRPEKVIVAVGHNCLFKELTNGQKSLRNCEVHTMAI